MQLFDISTLSSVMQRPSAENEWQHPAGKTAPIPSAGAERLTPLEVQAASYLALSESIVNLSIMFMINDPLK